MSQGREGIVKRGPGRPPRSRHSPYARLADSEFKFKTGNLVLVKWTDGMVYFAKIKKIDYKRQKCAVVFDDKSQDEAHFRQIHSVDETTTDIICIKCKKDDSDKPNEIVLCDECCIGFHQKCHLPNIPASALELSTPWKCSYCQKGVKCPYLIESSDLQQNLQNLWSDDEGSGTEDNIDATNTFDSDHYEPAVVDEVSILEKVSPRKKRGRKPAAEATVAMKRERRRVHQSQAAPHQSSSIVTMDFRPQLSSSEAWKPKSYAPSNEDGDSEPVYISSGKSTPEPSPRPTSSAAQVGVKRKRLHHGTSPGSGGGKKQKRSSVESRTISVTRVSVPVYDSSSSAEEIETSRDSSVCESSFSSSGSQGLGSIREESAVHEKRPRSLRVSLSIPDEVEPGTPFDKVMKVHHHQRASSPQHHRDLSSTETKELPSWENFENSNLLHRASSPKQRPKTLTTEKSDVIFTKSNTTTTTIKPAPEPAVSAPSKNTHSAFLASPLPISSSPKLPAAVTTPSSAPAPDVKASVRSSSSGSSSFSSLDVGVKNKTASSQQQSSPPLPTAVPVGVGYSAPAPAADVVTTKPSAPVVAASQQPESNPSILPPQRGPHPPNQPQSKPANLSKPPSGSATSTTSTPATPPSGPSTTSPATKPITVPTETSAPNPNPISGGIPPVPAGQQRPQPQQQSVLVSVPGPQPAPTSTIVPSPKSTGHVLVAQQKPLTQQQQQQLPSTAAPQKVPSVPAHLHHQSVAASIAQSTQSPSAMGQQMVVTSRPSIQQSVVVSNAQRPPSAPAMQQQQQQQVLNRPPSNVSAVNQSVIQQQQQQPVYVASTRPASVPGQKHQVVFSTARPSSVPIQQNRPPSVPTQQQQQQNVVIAPPRPSSVPTQLQQVVRSHSHSQSQSPSVSTPTQHVLVTYSQSGAPLKQVVVTQPPAYVTKSTAIFQAAQSTSMPPASTSVLTHASPVPVNVQYGGPVVQTQRQLQEQAIAAAKKHSTQSALGDADVIITAVESNMSRANQGQSVGYHSAVTPSGEKIMILNASSGEGAIPYQPTALSAGMGVRKVMAKAVDVSGQMVPSGSASLPIAAAASGQTQFVSTAAVGSQAPASVVPVVLAPASNSLPISTMASPQVVYQVSTNPQIQPSATQVARGATSMRTVSVSNSNNNLANGTRAVQVLANSQPTTPVIVACVPGSAGQPVGVSTTKPYAIVNAMPGTAQIPAAASLPQPPKTYSLVPKKQTQEKQTQHREVVQTISKKIGDAFDSGNEKLLVAAFEDAWKKFQANGEQYKPPGGHIKLTGTTKVVSKDPPPPNAEVFAVPGTTSRVSLVRQTSANRTVLAPKTSSPIPTQQVIAPPPLSSKEQTQSYVYTAATSADQPAQVYLQQITTGQKQQQQQSLSHSKVHSSGLFYPPSSTESVTVVQKKAPGPGTGIQRIVVSQSSSGVHHSRSGDRPVRETSESQQTTTTHRRRSSKSKYCARCGKSATYLCSGCHMEWYCGRECQLKAWDAHAEHCKA